MSYFGKWGAAILTAALSISFVATDAYAEKTEKRPLDLTGKWVGTQLCHGIGDKGAFVEFSCPNSPIIIHHNVKTGELLAFIESSHTSFVGVLPKGTAEDGVSRQFSLANCFSGLPFDNSFVEVIIANLGLDGDTFFATSLVTGNKATASPSGESVGNFTETCTYNYKKVCDKDPLKHGFVKTPCGLVKCKK